MMTQKRVPPNKVTVRAMIALIVLLVICIIFRWGYVKEEVMESVVDRFQSQPKPLATPATETRCSSPLF